jgi:sec-independent protein translocase protein TatC
MANKSEEMGVFDHLDELRRRLIISALAILIVTAVAFFFSDVLLNVLLLPAANIQAGGVHLKAFSLMDGFAIKWRVALYCGIVVAFPVWAYQVYSFVSPGLLDHERRAVFPTLASSLVLFALGAVFGYYLLWGMIRVLVQLFPAQVDYLPGADDYISFVTFFLLSSGLAFQLPVLLTVLVYLRILSSEILRKQRRIAYFALFVFAEIITPVSDPIVAPLTVMVPLVVLYEISIWVARSIESSRLKAAANQKITPRP